MHLCRNSAIIGVVFDFAEELIVSQLMPNLLVGFDFDRGEAAGQRVLGSTKTPVIAP